MSLSKAQIQIMKRLNDKEVCKYSLVYRKYKFMNDRKAIHSGSIYILTNLGLIGMNKGSLELTDLGQLVLNGEAEV